MHLINNHRVELFESVEDLPMIRFQKYSKYVLIDSGVGNTYEDVLKKIAKVNGYIERKDFESAKGDLKNMALSVSLVFSEMNLKSLAFACLVKSVDDEPVTDISEEGLQKVLLKLQHERAGLIFGILSRVKKNWTKS